MARRGRRIFLASFTALFLPRKRARCSCARSSKMRYSMGYPQPNNDVWRKSSRGRLNTSPSLRRTKPNERGNAPQRMPSRGLFPPLPMRLRGDPPSSCCVVSCRVVLRRDLRRDRRRQVRRRREALRPVHPARAPPLGLAPARARGRRRAPRAAPGMPLICSQSPSPVPLSRIARNHPFDNPPLVMMQLDARGLEMPRRDGVRFRVQSKRREKMYYQERLPSFPTQSHSSLFLLRARSPISFASSSTS